jgi:RNA polymerase sigma factor (sigma-70 family)
MPPPDSVSRWLADLRGGDREVTQKLWEAYFPRLVALARERLRAVLPRRAAGDEEDVALSAFASFVRAAEAGRFPRLGDRDDLWQVLIVVTARKAIDWAEHERRAKRDARRTVGQADLDAARAGDPSAEVFAGLARGGEPDPQFAAEVADQCRHLLARLPDDQLRRIAVLRMEGYIGREIAERLDLAPATIDRRLARIRQIWGGASE